MDAGAVLDTLADQGIAAGVPRAYHVNLGGPLWGVRIPIWDEGR